MKILKYEGEQFHWHNSMVNSHNVHVNIFSRIQTSPPLMLPLTPDNKIKITQALLEMGIIAVAFSCGTNLCITSTISMINNICLYNS